MKLVVPVLVLRPCRYLGVKAENGSKIESESSQLAGIWICKRIRPSLGRLVMIDTRMLEVSALSLQMEGPVARPERW